MKKIIYIGLLCFLFAAFLISCSQPEKSSPLTEDEYQIYAVIIDSLYVTSNRPVVLIGANTETYPKDPEALTLDSRFALPSEYNWNELLNSFRQNNGTQFPVNPTKIETPITKIPITRQNMFEQLNSQLQELDRNQTMNYREKLGIYWFSRAGFNADNTQAFIFTDFLCGARCGWPSYYLLTKSHGDWKIVQDFQMGRY